MNICARLRDDPATLLFSLLFSCDPDIPDRLARISARASCLFVQSRVSEGESNKDLLEAGTGFEELEEPEEPGSSAVLAGKGW